MSLAYLDTSAIVKLYVAETGSDWLRALLGSPGTPTMLTSHLTAVEAPCAFARRRREGSLSPRDCVLVLAAFDHDAAYHFNILDVQAEVVNKARDLAGRHPLRAYDAVHLATAWLANRSLVQAGQSPLTFVCADDVLLSIAQAEGMLVDNPNNYA